MSVTYYELLCYLKIVLKVIQFTPSALRGLKTVKFSVFIIYEATVSILYIQLIIASVEFQKMET